MATSFGEPIGGSANLRGYVYVRQLTYTVKPVRLHQVKAGDRIEHDGRVYRIFRFIPVAKPTRPLGCVALAVRHDAQGNPVDDSVALCFDDSEEIVFLVCDAEVPQ